MLAAGVSYYLARLGIDERRAKQDAEGTRSSQKLDCEYPPDVEQPPSAQVSLILCNREAAH